MQTHCHAKIEAGSHNQVGLHQWNRPRHQSCLGSSASTRGCMGDGNIAYTVFFQRTRIVGSASAKASAVATPRARKSQVPAKQMQEAEVHKVTVMALGPRRSTRLQPCLRVPRKMQHTAVRLICELVASCYRLKRGGEGLQCMGPRTRLQAWCWRPHT